MSISESVKDQIKRRADIVELIGQFVQLKKTGKNHSGLCPFHAEKDPSFTVSSERQMFHCFGCKKGGDIFAFWMAYHNYTFPEALRDLAERYHIPMDEGASATREREKSELRKRLFAANETATSFYENTLADPKQGKPGMDYLKRRGILESIIKEFRLGYAPDAWQGLHDYLKDQNIDPKIAVQAGLIIPKKNGGYYDRFRGRIMFPILNLRGRVTGFGGRVLDNGLPKYLNTPESPIFHKGEFPYGLHASFKAIRERGRAVITEGYMDFLALRRYGLNEAVATLGTALTGEHIRKIKGYAKEAVVVFDSDEAGKTAALSSLPLFLNEGLSAKAVVLPDGHDPDTFLKENGPESFEKLLTGATPLFDFYLDQKLSPANTGIEGKIALLKELLPVLLKVRNRAQRSLYINRVSQKTGIKEDVILSELEALKKTLSPDSFERGIRARVAASQVEGCLGDFQLLNLICHHPDTVQRLMDCECHTLLSDPVVTGIVSAIFEVYGKEGEFLPERLVESLDSEEMQITFREMLVSNSIYSSQEVQQAIQEIETKVYHKKLSDSFNQAQGDPAAMNRLLKLKAEGPPRPYSGKEALGR
ncbi:MAG: DNA primase [Desulfatiglandaceae bacterium]